MTENGRALEAVTLEMVATQLRLWAADIVIRKDNSLNFRVAAETILTRLVALGWTGPVVAPILQAEPEITTLTHDTAMQLTYWFELHNIDPVEARKIVRYLLEVGYAEK